MKKYSVGDDQQQAPQKGKKKGIIIIAVVVIILLALFAMTGCSSENDGGTITGPTSTPVSVLSQLQSDIDGLENRVKYIEDHPYSYVLPSAISSLPDSIIDLENDLEALRLNISTFDATELLNEVAQLTYNISILEGQVASILSPTPTPVGNGSTPTPTPTGSATPIPTPTPACVIPDKPELTTPTDMSTGVPASFTTFYWDSCTNAVSYKVYVSGFTGITTNETALVFPFLLSANTSYAWKVVSVSDCGMVNDSSVWTFTTVP